MVNRLCKPFSAIEDKVNPIETNKKYEDVWIIGGESIYKSFLELNLISECYITFVDNSYDCDTFFPIDLLKLFFVDSCKCF